MSEPTESRYWVFLDEHGTLTGDVDDEPFGYGCFLIGDADADVAREAVRRAFPGGFHMKSKNAKGKRRVLERLSTVLGGCPSAAAHGLVLPPGYARQTSDRFINAIGIARLAPLVAAAHVERSGLISPRSVLGPLYRIGRKFALYGLACRLPIVALLASIEASRLLVSLKVGSVGAPQQHNADLALMEPQLRKLVVEGTQNYVAAKVLPSTPFFVEMESIARSDDPLFDLADAYASVSRHVALGSPQSEALYAAASGMFQRLRWPGSGELRPGIVRLGVDERF